jgi:hypothetical protein
LQTVSTSSIIEKTTTGTTKTIPADMTFKQHIFYIKEDLT